VFPKSLTVIGCALALSAVAWAQGDAQGLEQLWRTGQFDAAREIIATRNSAGDRTPQFLGAAARCTEEMHDYAPAADLWSAYAGTLVTDNNAYRDAREHEWRCRWVAAGQDPGAQWIASAQAEIAAKLEQTFKIGPARQLALELERVLQEITSGELTPSKELRVKYPRSEVVLRAAKRAVDELATQEDEAARSARTRQFLADYPGCYWRHVAYRYMLYGDWLRGDLHGLRTDAAAYLSHYPVHPDSHGSVSRYFLEADIELDAGLKHAKRSVELYETALGLDGSPDTLRRFQAETRDLPRERDYLPPGKRQQFTDYLGSRFNLARYLLAAGDANGALALVKPVLDLDPFSPDEELTLAPFYLIAGQAEQALGDRALAYRCYLGALCEGDPTGRYALQAASALSPLAAQLDEAQLEQARLAYVPQALSAVPLPQFTDVTGAAGLKGYAARRVAWGDTDGDGRPDLLLDGGVLLHNELPAGFSDVTNARGLHRSSGGGVFADVDNDGDLDLYTFADGKRGDHLWRNEGSSFVDVTTICGDPTDDDDSSAAAFLDYDGDGCVDLYVANTGLPSGAADRLYHNAGTGVLRYVDPAKIGMSPHFGETCAAGGAGAADFDNDGDQDVFVGNYRLQGNMLFRNDGGDFTNVARLVGAAGLDVDGFFGSTLGSAWGDVNNDGLLDLFCCNQVDSRQSYLSNKSMLLIAGSSDQQLTFADRRAAMGIRFASTCVQPLLFDANNDGWLDLFVTAAYQGRGTFLYVNDGQGRFHDMTYLAGARLFDTWGCAAADYDLDGDVDLAVAGPGGVRLLRNDSPPEQWLQVACLGGMPAARKAGAASDPGYGRLSNGAAIGARITIGLGKTSLIREIQCGQGVGCGNELIAHFGLGGYRGRISVIVRFPSGRVATRALMEANQRLVIPEYEGPTEAVPPLALPQPVSPEKPAPLTRDTGARPEGRRP